MSHLMSQEPKSMDQSAWLRCDRYLPGWTQVGWRLTLLGLLHPLILGDPGRNRDVVN